MRLDHFGHNYEFSMTAPHEVSAKTTEEVCPQLSSRSRFLTQGGLNASKLAKLQADRRPLHSVRRLREGTAPDQRRNARVNALDSE